MPHLDPVCGMTIEEDEAVGSVEHAGTTYLFCNPNCLEQFKADPQRYLQTTAESRAAEVASDAEGVEYTCPMHPEIVRLGPGACPLCGMALEPRVVCLTDGPNPELLDMTRRFRLAALLGARSSS